MAHFCVWVCFLLSLFVVATSAASNITFVDVAFPYTDPYLYRTTDLFDQTTGSMGIPGRFYLTHMQTAQLWDAMVNSTEILPGVRFRAVYIPIPYPTNSTAYWIDLWVNETLAANGTIPLIWYLPPVIAGPSSAVLTILDRYPTISFLSESWSSFIAYTRAPFNMSRAYPKLLLPLFCYENIMAPVVRFASTLPGKRLVFVFNNMYSFQELTSSLLTNASAQLGVQYIPMRVNTNNGTEDIPRFVQQLIQMDPELVVVDAVAESNARFIAECKRNFWFPKALVMRGVDSRNWATTDRRYWFDLNLYNDLNVLLNDKFEDFYFPQNLTSNTSSLAMARNAFTLRIAGDNNNFGLGTPAHILSGLSIVHRAIVASGNWNDSAALQQYIEANVWPTMIGRVSFNYAGVNEGIDRTMTQYDAKNVQQAVWPQEIAKVSIVYPMPLGCPPPAPTNTSICDRNTVKWISPSISLGSNTTTASGAPSAAPPSVVITSPLIVNGNVSIIRVTLVLGEGNSSASGRTLEPAVINSTGCVSIDGGDLQLPFTLNGSVSSGDAGFRTLVISQSSCLSGQFSSISVVLQNASDICLDVVANPTYTSRDLSVVFSVSSSNRCSSDVSGPVATWIIVVGVVVPVVAIIAIVALLLAIPATRHRIAPGWDFRGRIRSIRRTTS